MGLRPGALISVALSNKTRVAGEIGRTLAAERRLRKGLLFTSVKESAL